MLNPHRDVFVKLAIALDDSVGRVTQVQLGKKIGVSQGLVSVVLREAEMYGYLKRKGNGQYDLNYRLIRSSLPNTPLKEAFAYREIREDILNTYKDQPEALERACREIIKRAEWGISPFTRRQAN